MSGNGDFRFDNISKLSARLSFLLKHATLANKHLQEIEDQNLLNKINEDKISEPTIGNPLNEIFEIIDDPEIEHKKSMFPHNALTLETADEIERKQQLTDEDFIDLQTKFDQVNDVATEQKKEKKLDDLIDSVTDNNNSFSTFDNFWWEDEMFSDRDSPETIEASKNYLGEINEMSDNILRNLRPVDNWTIDQLIDDEFIPIDSRIQQGLEDDYYHSLESESEDNKVTFENDFETDSEDNKVTIENDFDIDDFNKKTYRPVDDSILEEIIYKN